MPKNMKPMEEIRVELATIVNQYGHDCMYKGCTPINLSNCLDAILSIEVGGEVINDCHYHCLCHMCNLDCDKRNVPNRPKTIKDLLESR